MEGMAWWACPPWPRNFPEGNLRLTIPLIGTRRRRGPIMIHSRRPAGPRAEGFPGAHRRWGEAQAAVPPQESGISIDSSEQELERRRLLAQPAARRAPGCRLRQSFRQTLIYRPGCGWVGCEHAGCCCCPEVRVSCTHRAERDREAFTCDFSRGLPRALQSAGHAPAAHSGWDARAGS